MSEKECGAYIITHMESGSKYVGSTNDLRGRKQMHIRHLNAGIHANPELQALYDQDRDLHFNFQPTDTREEAFDVEQMFLDNNIGNVGFLNRLPNARAPGAGNTWTKGNQNWLGKKHTEETKAKMRESAADRPKPSEEEKQRLRTLRVGVSHTDEVRRKMSESHTGKPSPAARPVMINGVEYRSGLEAARLLGIPSSTVKKKLNDPNNHDFVKLEKK